MQAEALNVFRGICIAAIMLAGTLFLTYRETSRLTLVLFVVLDIALLESGRAGILVIP